PRAADDVVGYHSGDVQFLLFCHLRPVSRTVEALLFSGDGHEYQGRIIFVPGHHSRDFHNSSGAGSVVIRAGSVGLCVANILSANARVVMAAYDVNSIL